MNGLIRATFAVVLLSLPVLGFATEPAAQRGAPIARFLDGQGHLRMPEGYAGSLDPRGYRMVTEAGRAPTFVSEAALAPQVSDSGQWDAFGGVRNSCNGPIRAIARMENGNLVVAGSFSVCTDSAANNIAIYAPSSNTWSSVGTSSANGVNGSVEALAVSGSDLYVGGNFTQAGGTSANRVARWNGSSWSSLGIGSANGANQTVLALAVSGGEIYIGGVFTQAGSVEAKNVARWNGNVWSSLGSGIGDGMSFTSVSALAVSGGDLYVGGQFTQAGGAAANSVARWNGSSWASLGTGIGVGGSVSALAVAGSDVYVGGYFTQAGGVPANCVARWNGSAWSSLGVGSGDGVDSTVYALAAFGSDIYVGGVFTQAGGAPANRVARWNGSAWSSFGSGTSGGYNGGEVRALAVSGSDIYVGGEFVQAGGAPANYVARWNGGTWASLGIGTGDGVNGTIYALAVAGSDLYVGGFFTQAGGTVANNVARWNGSVWSSLGTGNANGVNYYVYDLEVSGSNLYVGGWFTQAGGAAANGVARWNGSTWASLGSGSANGVTGIVYTLAVSGSDLYVGGFLNQAGGAAVSHVARWNGSAWTGVGDGLNDTVSALAVSGGDLYVGGRFTQAGGVAANGVAHWNGSVWASLGTGGANGVSGNVTALGVSGTDLFVGGNLNQAGGAAANGVARWNGSAWTNLGGGIGSTVSTLAVSGSDLYVGGYFTQAGGTSANRVARWNGSSWSSLGSGIGDSVALSYVAAVAVSGNDLYVAGSFGDAGGLVSSGIAKWIPNTAIFASGFEAVTPVNYTASPPTLTFSAIAAGADASQNVAVTASAGNGAALQLSLCTISGTNAADFSVTSPVGATTVAAGTTTNVVVRFAPTVAAPASRSATLNCSTPNATAPNATSFTVALSGAVIQPVVNYTVPPAALNFGAMAAGASASITLAVAASAANSAALELSQCTIGGTNAPDFSVTSPVGATTVAAGTSANVVVRFEPVGSAPASRSATLNCPTPNATSPNFNGFVVALSGAVIQSVVLSLNDTGIDWCANNTTSNLSCPQASFPDQDGDYGRDARARAGQLVKIGAGEAGFDYTKISNSGTALPANAALGAGANDWACTRDNNSGLIWEVKVNNAASLRHRDHLYTWYDPNPAINGGSAGVIGTAASCNSTLSQCNTSAYVTAVNAQGLCGANNWRMPTQEELLSIIHYGRFLPALDPAYFQNISSGPASQIWAGENAVYGPSSATDARFVSFNYGEARSDARTFNYGILLVRRAP